MRTCIIFGFLILSSAAAYGTNDFNTLWRQGRAALESSDLKAARQYFGEACPSGSVPSSPPAQLALCEHEYAAIEYAEGRVEQAEAHFLHALQAWEQADDSWAAHHVRTLLDLGHLYHASRRYEDAMRRLNEALELSRPLEAAYPQLVGAVLCRLGSAYSESGQLEQGRALLNGAIQKLRALKTPDPPELAYAYSALGVIDLRSGSYAAGESDLRQAVSMATKALGDDNPETAIYQADLGLALYLQGNYDGAITLLHRACFVLESKQGENSYQLGIALAEQSAVESALAKFGQAENDGSRAVEIFNRQLPAGNTESVLAQVNLAKVYLREHKTAAAELILPDAVAGERRLIPDSRALADGLRHLAQLRSQQRAWGEAEALYREALAIYDVRLGAAHPEVVPVRREYAQVLKHSHTKSAALASPPPA